MKLVIVILALIDIALLVYILLYQQFGARIRAKTRKLLRQSPQHHATKKRFSNNQHYMIPLDKEKIFSVKSIRRFNKNAYKRPHMPLPIIKPNFNTFCEPSENLKFIWLGHSSILLNFAGLILLIDPVFAKSSAPVSFITKRFQPPVVKLNELPKVDYIVLSHDHYDHLDMHTIKFFRKSTTKFLTPLGVGEHLHHWGISKERIIELDWWQHIDLSGLEFILTPAQHFSGRRLLDYKSTLWGSWVIRNNKHNIYFSGDSGYAKHFKEIGNKYGPFDLAFVENGQYDPAWRDVHMLPTDTICAMQDLNAKICIPIHWGVFCLAPHNWYDPIESIYNLAKEHQVNLYTPKLGQEVILHEHTNQRWWTSV